MEADNNNELNNNNEFITFLKTILMILENHNFKDTVTIFLKECDKLNYKGINPNIQRDIKSPPKIILENFSKTEPCRIIIENYDSDEKIFKPSILEDDVPNIPIPNKKKKLIKMKESLNHEIIEMETEKQSDLDNKSMLPNGETEKQSNLDNENMLPDVETKKQSDINNEIMLHNVETEKQSDLIINESGKDILTLNSNESKEKHRVKAADNIIVEEEIKTPKKQDNISNSNEPHETNNIETVENSRTEIKQNGNENVPPNTEKHQTPNEYEALKNKFSYLQIEHQKLIDIVTELTFALQTSIKGQIDDTHIILNNCEKIYPELFCNKPIEINSDLIPQNAELVKQIKSNNGFVNNDLKTVYEPVPKPCFNLDFQKIKHDLKNADIDTKLLLLQALRWRITKTPDIVREHVIRTYIRQDILNVHCCSHKSGHTYPKNSIVFTSFYCSCKSPQSLQQAVTRFVNAFASVKTGRDYIIHQSVILNILLSVMLGTHPSTPQIDEITRDMIIATLQKISLRYTPRMIMITDGLTEYITMFLLANHQTLNEYCLEYSIALLRNLWLHSESKEKCHPIAQDVMKLLANLLDEQYVFCLPYIIGSLYNLLPDDYFHKAATNINLEKIILDRIEKLEGEMREQLQYVLEIFLSADYWHPLCECDLGTDTENEMDVIEPEIDLNESINYANSNGEQFLYKYQRTYSIDGAEINPYYINNIFSIPVTPNVSIPASAKYNNPQNPKLPELEFFNESIDNKKLNQYKEVQIEDNTFNDVEEEETSNKTTEIEMTFCEETQQLYVIPSKDRIFEPDKTYKLRTFSPSFLKNIGEYDVKNISKSLPVSASKTTVAQIISPTANHSGICYREGFKPRSYSESNTPHIGFCFEENEINTYKSSKYSCACFAEMQRSFEEDQKRNNNEKVNNLAVKNTITENTISTNYCKYKCYPTSNSAPLQTASKKERDSGTSKSLDDDNYTAVFESRPRILRTP